MIGDKPYDIVIIGSGLGGLACGGILSQEGYRVCILEQHRQIGGCLQDFKRKGKRFDTGMHYMGSYGEGEILNRLFRYFNIYDKIEVQPLRKDGFDVLTINGEEFAYPQGMENFQKALINRFPDEEDAIISYLNKINQIFESVDLLNLREIDNFELSLKDSMDINVHDYIASLTQNKKLQNILAGLNSLYAGEKQSASLYLHAIINKFFIQSAWRVVGGGGQIADAFKTVIEGNGGELLTQKKVVDFHFEGNVIDSVVLSDGQQIQGKQFISNIHPAVMLDMIAPGRIRKVYVKRIKGLKNTVSTFCLYAALKDKMFKYINSNIYYYKVDDVWALSQYKPEAWPNGFMLYATESKKYPGYAESLVVMTPMRFEEVKPWEDSYIEKRGEGYKQWKNEKAEVLLDVVAEKFPTIRSCIDEYYTSSPLTYRDYTGTVKGSMYGVEKDCNHPMLSHIMPKTKINNLFLTGQNINLHGVLGVSMGAILTCGEIIGINHIIRKLRNS